MAADDYNPVSLSSPFSFSCLRPCAFTLFDLGSGCSEIVSGLSPFTRDKVFNSPVRVASASAEEGGGRRRGDGRRGCVFFFLFFLKTRGDDKSAHVTLAV